MGKTNEKEVKIDKNNGNGSDRKIKEKKRL